MAKNKKSRKKQKVFVVIAAYNEESAIGKVIGNLKQNAFVNVVVVDDGSKDKTFENAEKASATVLRHIVNRGQGAALQTGIDYSLDEGADVIVTFDADGQHQVKDVKKMLPLVESGEYDVVLGSRFLEGAGEIPFHRKFVLKVSVFVQWLFYGVLLSDAHNGLRVMSRKAARRINITSDKMEHASQIAEEIMVNKLRFKEVPVDILYTDYSLAKGQNFRHGFKVLFEFMKRKLLK